MNARTVAPLQACLAEALELARGWVSRWLEQTQAELGLRELAARHGREKHGLGEARHALAAHRLLLGQRFLAALNGDLHHEAPAHPQAAGDGPASRPFDSLSFDDLELMDDVQLQASVDFTRVQQIVKIAAADELAAFSARLSRAQGFEVLRVDANPWRPEAVVSALMAALNTLHVTDETRAHWLAAGADSLGQQLAGFYRQLDQWLDQHGVQPAGYLVIQSPTSRAQPAKKLARSAADSVPAEAVPERDALLSLDHLHDLLAGNLARAGSAVSDHGRSGSGNAMVRTLAGELVTRLLNRTVEDTRLLPCVREMVQQLKAPLRQLARTDPAFFADRQNPARRLLDGITAQGMAFATEQDTGFDAFARSLLGVVCDLQAPVHSLPQRLADALQHFSSAPPMVAAPPVVPARATAPAPMPLPQRDLLVEQLVAEFQARDDFARAPGVVRRFVTGPWAQVVAHARLNLGATDGALAADAPLLRYIDVLTDLLWSSQLVLASRNRPRLIQAVPKVLRTLREGLDTIDYPRPQAEAFFHALLGLQDAAYLTQHSVDVVCAPVWADAGHSAQSRSGNHTIPVRAGVQRDDGRLIDSDFSSPPDFCDTEPVTSDWLALAGREAPPVADGLTLGDWVELNESGHTARYQLNWASPHGRLFLFAAPHGRSVSLSRSGVQRLHSAGRLRLVPDEVVAAGLRH